MGMWERQTQKLQKRKTPSFSTSLLDTIYLSIDEPRHKDDEEGHDSLLRRNTAPQFGEEIENLRRAIMVEKWMENYSNAPPSVSGSSTDSALFSSSETESSVFPKKKAKDPNSPRGRISRFLNSIFSPRSLKKNQVLEELNSVRKSRSIKSCLNKAPSCNNNIKSVKFCPDIVDREKSLRPPAVRRNLDGFRSKEGLKNQRKQNEFRRFFENESEVDDRSCASSDLFELESIARIGSGAYEQELPVYGTTNLKHLIM